MISWIRTINCIVCRPAMNDSDSSKVHKTMQLSLIMYVIKHFAIDHTGPNLKAFTLLLH